MSPLTERAAGLAPEAARNTSADEANPTRISPEHQFRGAVQSAGLTPPDVIEPGRFHRFPGAGKRGSNTAGYCNLFPDGMGGVFGDFSRDLHETWQARRDQPFTQAEREAFREQVEQTRAHSEVERDEKQAAAATRAAKVWEQASVAQSSPYLAKKHVKAHGVRVNGETLLVPMRDSTGRLWNLQRIAADGTKRFLRGGRVRGCFFVIGEPNGNLCIAEGFATAASIHECTGVAVAVAFNAGNLEAVAIALGQKFPHAQIIVCADDDYRTAGNPGLTEATRAAMAVGGLVAVPDFGPARPEGATDFNDLAQQAGVAAVKQAIANARSPEAPHNPPEGPSISAASANGSAVEIMRADSIKPEAVDWLWNGYLAAGKVHLIAGAPGTGKTTLALAIAATVSAGGRWPDGTRTTPGDVLIWSGEDSPADTLIPRLIAMGADLRRVHIVGGTTEDGGRRWFDPARDFPALAAKATRLPDLRLMIVDPISAAVAGDSHNNSETRRGLQPLVEFAERGGCAVYGVTHFAKSSAGRDPIERVVGSIAFAAVARIVMATAKLPEQEGGGRVFVRAKSNIGPDGGGFGYELRQVELEGEHRGINASRVEWRGPIEGTARDILGRAEPAEQNPERAAALAEAKAFLERLLANGPVPAKQVRAEASEAGIASATLRRASTALRIKRVKVGMDGGWTWALRTEGAQQTPEDAQPQEVSTFVEDEHLRDTG